SAPASASAPRASPPGADDPSPALPSSALSHFRSSDLSASYADRPSTLHDPDPSLGHTTFDLSEAAIVLSNYDLGVISAVREFRRGSRHSPKLLIKSEKGAFILKRRAHGRDDPVKVAFTHQVQRKLAKAGYPLPRIALVRNTDPPLSMLNLGGRIYELFEYVRGEPYDMSLHATYEAGQGLALFHKILAEEKPDWEPPGTSYHRASFVPPNLAFIPHRLNDGSLVEISDFLRDAYIQAGNRVEDAGFAAWPRQIAHGDWHPGNMLFRGSKIVAVIDYDTARVLPRGVDVANGALQFSITRTGGDPDEWTAEPDEGRLKRFCRGYDSVALALISQDELRAMPWLMIEAIIAEAALPIAATGRFGRFDAPPILRMVQRKVRWLQSHGERIARLVA
ncbi:MAG TPA: hypothetical protein DEB06_05675, partial [Phycisphaerales bacterium]|nr:hypothetical protein [Phycisphaerales bacterium]